MVCSGTATSASTLFQFCGVVSAGVFYWMRERSVNAFSVSDALALLDNKRYRTCVSVWSEQAEQGLRGSPAHLCSYAGTLHARRRFLAGNDVDSLRPSSSFTELQRDNAERCYS